MSYELVSIANKVTASRLKVGTHESKYP
ncbi:hypothetical protein M2189_008721 [Bradyrhizobium japonicum]|nr:hypothetical protein [Bradyrhizobium japonicum]MCS3965518.1 hypothetical protein [Bradyrhizobium japonicum]MCS3997825.1 hypothetical protein [Bradyrhizobium japonicum]